jgi:hypothetical protein
MRKCKGVLGVVGRAWAVSSVAGLFVFGFLDVPTWVSVESNGGWGAARAFIIIVTYLGGVICACNYANDCG